MKLMFTFGIRLFKRAKAFCLIAVAGGAVMCSICFYVSYAAEKAVGPWENEICGKALSYSGMSLCITD